MNTDLMRGQKRAHRECASSFTGRVWAAIAAVALLLAALPSRAAAGEGYETASPESVGMSSERLERLTALMQGYIDKNLLAGTVTLIARKGKVVHFEAQGYRYREGDEPMTKDSIFTIMSMTKPIVSVALMMLYEEGNFLLDDPISKWLPGYADKQVRITEEDAESGEDVTHLVPADRPVTVRHILTHTSGLSTRDRSRAARPAPSTSPANRPQSGQRPPRELIAVIEGAAEIPLAFQPGEQWRYGSSTDYVAALVEKISGMNLDEYLKEKIFGPLGMPDTHYNIPQSKIGRVAAVYSPSGPNREIELRREPTIRETSYFGGVAGLKSTAVDYYRFHQMMLNGGELDGVRILSPKTVDLMITNHIGDLNVYIRGPGYGFGLGYSVLRDPGKTVEPLSPGTFSWGGAYGTIFWVDPIEDMIGVFMTQISSYGHLSVRQQFGVLATQAIIESRRNREPPTVLGYEVR
ncbi:beta-lactamase family protein [Candidatus Sumerlaeota bacterium]|nr:beta-lactamase family protein [Candidatus Sumerlaeota bacterium]